MKEALQEEMMDLVVVGGGPCGMAAAAAARGAGLSRVLLLEQGDTLGGVLPQCIHDGFGPEQQTGPEYALDLRDQVARAGVIVETKTTALHVSGRGPYTLWAAGPHLGAKQIPTRSILFATGCKERTRGQLRIPGARPAGVFTAGAAQWMMNVQNMLPGKSVLILGLGNIGLIMARRLTLEGVKVKGIVGERASGLMRNYVQCVKDWSIPVYWGHTICSIHGRRRLRGVTIAPLNSAGQMDLGKKQYLPCDTLLVAAGLIPEQALFAGREDVAYLDGSTAIQNSGALFACGNAVRVYDTVEEVTAWGAYAGQVAARRLLGAADAPQPLPPVGVEARKLQEADLLSLQEEDTLFCLLCPKGCRLQFGADGSLKGNGCAAGARFAEEERRAPRRMVTATVRLLGGAQPLLPVKTSVPVPKEKALEVARVCKRLKVQAPITRGTVLIPRVGGTAADLLAASDG